MRHLRHVIRDLVRGDRDALREPWDDEGGAVLDALDWGWPSHEGEAERQGECGHVIEHHAGDADDALREPEEELGDKHERWRGE